MSEYSVADLRKLVAPEFVLGAGAAMLTGQYAANSSIKKALVVTGPVLVEKALADACILINPKQL